MVHSWFVNRIWYRMRNKYVDVRDWKRIITWLLMIDMFQLALIFLLWIGIL